MYVLVEPLNFLQNAPLLKRPKKLKNYKSDKKKLEHDRGNKTSVTRRTETMIQFGK